MIVLPRLPWSTTGTVELERFCAPLALVRMIVGALRSAAHFWKQQMREEILINFL